MRPLIEFQELLYLYRFFWFLLYSPPYIAEVSLGLLIKFVFHGEDFSFFSRFYSLYLIYLLFFIQKKKTLKFLGKLVASYGILLFI